MNILRWWLFLVCAAPLGAAERDFVKTFPAGASVAVDVETYRGAILVAESERREVKIAVRVEIGAEEEPDVEKLMDGFSFEANQAGHEVTIRVRHPRQSGARFVWNEDRQVLPTVRLTVPARCDLRLRTTQGAITVGNIAGRLQAENDSGDIFFRTVGGTVEIKSDTGQVVVSRCLGSLRVEVRQGLIQVGTVTGPCQLTNHSGEIEVQNPKGELKAYAEAGGVTVGVPADFAGPGEVRTSGGMIVAQVDPAASVRIEASASVLAKVQSQIPLKVEAGGADTRRLTGSLNGGNGRLTLRASGGDVRIVPREPGFE